MRTLLTVALTAALASPALCADLMITKSKHADAFKPARRPAMDSTETDWVGKDRMRIEDGDKVTIVRNDLKKIYVLDTKAKTYSTLDIPVDMKKYLPPDRVPTYENMMAKTKITLTPTTETKKIGDWNATKYTMTITMPGPGGDVVVNEDIWATKDVKIDRDAWNDLYGAMLSANPGGESLANEIKKLDGLPVLMERSQDLGGTVVKSREEVTAVATKDPPEGAYDLPKDYTEKPFDPSGGKMGPPGGHRGKPAEAGGDKPKEGDKPVPPPH